MRPVDNADLSLETGMLCVIAALLGLGVIGWYFLLGYGITSVLLALWRVGR